ncbi:hypothetical protein [Pajaroellobacter abortibovis]|uniref:Uncharacterized protein n=1 Tax=Pajaroellobacter abortibovis TaxID=1882918 RepID=A0A1L6MY43_9BACT|nr:hypothetical protein [Pajaroellobacter abortibovis]APS00377.1 hypothetical protein BCY86_06555 [Pajaroellobacter abortibovis]
MSSPGVSSRWICITLYGAGVIPACNSSFTEDTYQQGSELESEDDPSSPSMGAKQSPPSSSSHEPSQRTLPQYPNQKDGKQKHASQDSTENFHEAAENNELNHDPCVQQACPSGTTCILKDDQPLCTAIAFITSVRIRGDMQSIASDLDNLKPNGTGVKAAEDFCNRVAATGTATQSLKLHFSPWLSTEKIGTPTAWVSIAEYPVHNPKNEEIISRLANMYTTLKWGVDILKIPIHVDENGNNVQLFPDTLPYVWTGISGEGQATHFHCKEWTVATHIKEATVGSYQEINSLWTNYTTRKYCNLYFRLYCISSSSIHE